MFNNSVVLIVDDSYTIRHQVKMILKKYDFAVLEAYSHKTMMDNLSLNNKPIDLVIMDLGLKNETGYELMGAIRALKEHKKTPIIVLTGNAKKDAVIASTQYDISYYVIKPINPNDLALKVLTAVEHISKPHMNEVSIEKKQPEVLDPLDPISIKYLDNALKNTRMSQINKILDVDLSAIKRSEKGD